MTFERRSLMITQSNSRFYSLTDAEFGLLAALVMITLVLASRYAW